MTGDDQLLTEALKLDCSKIPWFTHTWIYHLLFTKNPTLKSLAISFTKDSDEEHWLREYCFNIRCPITHSRRLLTNHELYVDGKSPDSDLILVARKHLDFTIKTAINTRLSNLPPEEMPSGIPSRFGLPQ